MNLIFTIAALIQCGYVLYLFVRVSFIRECKAAPESARQPVSVIICARNQAENLSRFLPIILTQDYRDGMGRPMYEVIVVNDLSDDGTAQVLGDLISQYSHLRVVMIGPDMDRNLKGKKFALHQGQKAARHGWLLLTDADCRPSGSNWLALMTAPFAAAKEIVAGYGGYEIANGLLNAFTRWETLHTFVQYTSASLAGLPYMAVGRNMACTRAVLRQAEQGKNWNTIPSGDDDLLVRNTGTRANTALVVAPGAFTFTTAHTAWKDWVNQKQRHLSTGKYYKTGIKVLLGIYALSHALLWLSFFWLFFTAPTPYLFALMSIRCLLYWLIWGIAAYKTGEKKLFYWFPFFDIGWMIYNFAFLPYITCKNKQQWT